MLFAVCWQLAVLALVGVYIGLEVGRTHGSAAWIAPAVGLVVGTALPLQLVVMSLLRNLNP